MPTDDGRERGAGDGGRPTVPGHGRADAKVDVGADTAAATPEQLEAARGSQSGERSAPGTEVDLVGAVLEARYELTRKVGQGGMGAVYEATHRALGKRVAVKVLLERLADKESLVARLEQEARLASSIGHPNIIDITDFGQTGDGRTFVVMEFLEGESLGQVIAREGKLDAQRAIRVARQIASALAAAHEKGVVHRDLKPENVFLVARGGTDFVKVVDFGISKLLRPAAGGDTPRLTQTGMVLGTPLYMSPEQARGDETLDHRIDIYALGVILYEAVTGEVPFRGTNYLHILAQVVADEPPAPRSRNPACSIELEAVILKALAKTPARRYQSMDELGEDLAVLLTADGAARSTGARLSAMRRAPRRRAWLVPAVTGAVVAIGAAVVALRDPPEPPPPVEATPEPEAAVVAPTPVAGPEAAPPRVETVTVTIESDPPGATIYEGDLLVGRAPQQRTLVKKDKDVTFYLEKGPLSGSYTVNPMEVDGSAPLRVRLARGKTKRPAPPPDQRPTHDDTAGGDLTGTPYRP